MNLIKIILLVWCFQVFNVDALDKQKPNDIVYFNVLGLVLGVENIYYYKFNPEGLFVAYLRPKFAEELDFHSFTIGKLEELGNVEKIELIMREEGRPKFKKCGVTVLDLHRSEDYFYRIIHDGNEYISVKASKEHRVNYFLDQICGIVKELESEEKQIGQADTP